MRLGNLASLILSVKKTRQNKKEEFNLLIANQLYFYGLYHFETYQVYPLKLRIWGSYPEYYYKH